MATKRHARTPAHRDSPDPGSNRNVTGLEYKQIAEHFSMTVVSSANSDPPNSGNSEPSRNSRKG